MQTTQIKTSISRSPVWRSFLLIPLLLACFALASAPTAFGVVPAPDGGYPGGNTAEGDNALFNLTTGTGNTAIGSNALFHNTTGRNNTAEGDVALQNNTTGIDNTAIGVFALTNNTIGNSNTAIGFFALSSNTTGNSNTATGVEALINNSTGSNNTANGFEALQNNSTGHENTANGLSALQENTTGSFNTRNGVDALFGNTIGNFNTADGFLTLSANTTGNFNTANGTAALQNNTIGSNNTAAGTQALSKNITGINNTADGVNALFGNTTGNNNTATGEAALFRNTTGSSNIALGFNAGSSLTTGNNNIHIGNAGVAAEGNTIRVGRQGAQTRTFIAGISGVAVAGSAVVANVNGQLGIAASSERFKDEIKPMNKVSEALFAFKPVTFRYKKEIDPARTLQFGLVAEDVEKVNPALVARDKEGKAYTVRYDQVNAMLLNEFLKEHRKNEEQEKTIAELKSGMTTLAAVVKEQGSQIQKVSAQLATAGPSPGGLEPSRLATNRIRIGGPALQMVSNP